MSKPKKERPVAFLHNISKNIRTFCIITGNNPMTNVNDKDILSGEENDVRNKELECYLHEHAFNFFKIIDEYDIPGKSFIIYNIPLNFCKSIGKMFDQKSFVYAIINHGDSCVNINLRFYLKGSSEKSNATQKNKEYILEEEISKIKKMDFDIDADISLENYYTGIGKKFKVIIPFDIFNEGCAEIDSMVEERKENFPQYNELFESMMKLSIEPEGNYRTQRCARTFLYGANFQSMFTQ